MHSAYASIPNNTFIVSGEPQTKTIKDLLPDIVQQLGPKQHKLLQELVANLPQSAEDVPNLVEAPSTPQNLDSVEWLWTNSIAAITNIVFIISFL